MGYWTILIFCSVVLAVLITVTWYSVKKQNDRSELGCEMGVIVAISFTVFALVLDRARLWAVRKFMLMNFLRLLLCNIFNLLKQKVNILFLLKILTLISMKKMRNIAFHTQHLRRMCLI